MDLTWQELLLPPTLHHLWAEEVSLGKVTWTGQGGDVQDETEVGERAPPPYTGRAES